MVSVPGSGSEIDIIETQVSKISHEAAITRDLLRRVKREMCNILEDYASSLPQFYIELVNTLIAKIDSYLESLDPGAIQNFLDKFRSTNALDFEPFHQQAKEIYALIDRLRLALDSKDGGNWQNEDIADDGTLDFLPRRKTIAEMSEIFELLKEWEHWNKRCMIGLGNQKSWQEILDTETLECDSFLNNNNAVRKAVTEIERDRYKRAIDFLLDENDWILLNRFSDTAYGMMRGYSIVYRDAQHPAIKFVPMRLVNEVREFLIVISPKEMYKNFGFPRFSPGGDQKEYSHRMISYNDLCDIRSASIGTEYNLESGKFRD